MWMPDWLYERLPILYLVAGATCLCFLGATLASFLSAGAFFAAAGLSRIRRRDARRVKAARLRWRVTKRKSPKNDSTFDL